MSTDLSDGQMITTMLGEDVTISIMDGTVMVNDATVTVADIAADNGVVHVIDAVLLPPPAETTTVVDVIVNSETTPCSRLPSVLPDSLRPSLVKAPSPCSRRPMMP